MKFLEIRIVKSHIIETDASEFPTFRRNGFGNWENLMNESWEPVYDCKELDAMFDALEISKPGKSQP